MHLDAIRVVQTLGQRRLEGRQVAVVRHCRPPVSQCGGSTRGRAGALTGTIQGWISGHALPPIRATPLNAPRQDKCVAWWARRQQRFVFV